MAKAPKYSQNHGSIVSARRIESKRKAGTFLYRLDTSNGRTTYLPESYVKAWFTGNQLEDTGLNHVQALRKCHAQWEELAHKAGEPVIKDDGSPVMIDEDTPQLYTTTGWRLRSIDLQLSDEFSTRMVDTVLEANAKAMAKERAKAKYAGRNLFAAVTTAATGTTGGAVAEKPAPFDPNAEGSGLTDEEKEALAQEDAEAKAKAEAANAAS